MASKLLPNVSWLTSKGLGLDPLDIFNPHRHQKMDRSYVHSKHQAALLSVGQECSCHQAQASDQPLGHRIGSYFALGFAFE